MRRRNAIIAVAVVALGIATVSIAEAGGRGGSGGKGRPSTPAPVTTTRTVVNSTNEALFTYVYSGTAGPAQTVGAATAQGAKTISPSGRATFTVKPNGGGNQFGDTVYVYQASAITGDPNQSLQGTGDGDDVGVVPAGQNVTTTITGTWGSLNFSTP